MNRLWQAKLEVNVSNILYNMNSIRKIVGPDVEIMPIIKDNAYGTEINKRIDLLDLLKVNIVGVAIVDEGIALRENGYKGEIFILNQPLEEEISAISSYNLTVGIGSIDFLSKIGASNGVFKIHIEIGAGMGRTGIKPARVNEYIDEALKYSNIKIEGIYTHFSCSDCDEEYTRKQIRAFNIALDEAKKRLTDIKYIHCCNSAGLISFKEAHFNMVRPGLTLYGYLPDENLKDKIDLKPAIRLKSKISFLKEVDIGTSIGYGRTFIAERKTRIATVPIGYADGVRRAMSNRGNVVINGKIVPIIGTVCMDCFMVDVTDMENVNVGDEVFLWDNKNITVLDIAKIYHTINYEVISTIFGRVVREYIF